MVKLHKEQMRPGTAPRAIALRRARQLVCTLENSLLPAERTMVAMGEHQRVRETRMFLQVASQQQFIDAIEALVPARSERSPAPPDPAHGVVFEVFSFEPQEAAPERKKPPLLRGFRCPARSPLYYYIPGQKSVFAWAALTLPTTWTGRRYEAGA